jgi:hypothetical protein
LPGDHHLGSAQKALAPSVSTNDLLSHSIGRGLFVIDNRNNLTAIEIDRFSESLNRFTPASRRSRSAFRKIWATVGA